MAATRNSIFISYSRKDKQHLNELHAHLAYHTRVGIFSSFDDSKIRPGDIWWDSINKALKSARVGVFLVSADMLASDFIFKHELRPLLDAAKQEGVIILSVILRPCSFNDTELAHYQAINAPSDPLSLMTPGKREEVWLKLVKRIREVL